MCDGALLNFLAGFGNLSLVMSLTFTLSALAQIQLAMERARFPQNKIYSIDTELEQQCAALHFPELRPTVYRLSERQRNYLAVG